MQWIEKSQNSHNLYNSDMCVYAMVKSNFSILSTYENLIE